mmetsp:Transcript_14339/g.17371  ORF Transcript_14339/g.17371 Transcript_14339/m.17371 type:complete len:84 (-) Transcript_14339:5-256(-)
MPVICIGPVCIPVWSLLPFLVGVVHKHGYLKWFKQEWVTLRFWKKKAYALVGKELPKKKPKTKPSDPDSEDTPESKPEDAKSK